MGLSGGLAANGQLGVDSLAAQALQARVPSTLKFETFPSAAGMSNSATPGSTGVLVLQAVWLPAGAVITKLTLLGGTTALAWGSSWTGPHFIYGLYDPSTNLIAQTADGGGTATFSTTLLTSAENTITKDGSGNSISSVTTTVAGLHYIGLLINSGTGGTGFTYPTWRATNNSRAALSPILCGTNGTSLVALPAGPSLTIAGTSVEIYGGVA